jgi:branched-chain amino acid transport system ATP-binding protein
LRLEIREIHSGYGRVPALRGVSLDVRPRGVTTIVGPNGSGKTTLLRCISGLLKLWRGDIRWGERSLKGLAPDRIVRLGLSQVPQDRHVFPSMSVRDNLLMGIHPLSRSGKRDGLERVEAWLDRFPILRDRANSNASVLSGGEQQVLVIGRALVSDPEILLLDEPFLGLSPAAQGLCADLIASLREEGRTTVVTEQDFSARVEPLTDVLIEISRGQTVGRPVELKP